MLIIVWHPYCLLAPSIVLERSCCFHFNYGRNTAVVAFPPPPPLLLGDLFASLFFFRIRTRCISVNASARGFLRFSWFFARGLFFLCSSFCRCIFVLHGCMARCFIVRKTFSALRAPYYRRYRLLSVFPVVIMISVVCISSWDDDEDDAKRRGEFVHKYFENPRAIYPSLMPAVPFVLF